MNVIDKARERIERDGWTKHSFGVPGESMCVAGAVMAEERALREGSFDVDRLPPDTSALRAVAAEAGTGVLSISRWNDAPSTSLEDVVLVMKRASARLDEETR